MILFGDANILKRSKQRFKRSIVIRGWHCEFQLYNKEPFSSECFRGIFLWDENGQRGFFLWDDIGQLQHGWKKEFWIQRKEYLLAISFTKLWKNTLHTPNQWTLFIPVDITSEEHTLYQVTFKEAEERISICHILANCERTHSSHSTSGLHSYLLT